MNSQQINCFLILAKYLNFTHASEHLYLSQSALSKQISALEEELGIVLFSRKYKSVTLTPGGEIMFEYFRNAAASFQEYFDEAVHASQGQTRLVRLGLINNARPGNLFDLIHAYSGTYGDVRISIERGTVGGLLIDLMKDKYDCIITYQTTVDKTPRLFWRLLAETKIVLFARREPTGVRGGGASVGDFREECFFMTSSEDNDPTRELIVKICSKEGFSPKKLIYLSNIESVLTSVECGLGVTIGDETMQLGSGAGFAAIPTDEPSNLVIARKGGEADPRVAGLFDYIGDHFAL